MRMRPSRKPLIVLLVKRAVWFMAVMCALALFLYGVGTAQDFLESTQLFLLRLSYGLSLVLSVGAVYGTLIDSFFALRLRSWGFWCGAAAYVFTIAVAVGVAVFSGGLLVAVAGNSAQG